MFVTICHRSACLLLLIFVAAIEQPKIVFEICSQILENVCTGNICTRTICWEAQFKETNIPII